MPYFDTSTDGTRLHYVDYGPADGRTVVFVNGSYFGTEIWEFQMLALADEGYRCVGMDRRGHGRSDDVWGGFDLDTLADDVGALLDHLDLRDVTLVGHSVGASEAVRYLVRHGSGRVARLAMVAGTTPGAARSAGNPDGLDPAVMAEVNAAFRRDRPAFFADAAADFFALGRPGNEVSPSYVRYLVDRCTVSTARAGSELGDVVAGLDLAAELKGIDVPVLVVHGTHDTSAPIELTGRRAAELVPDGTLLVYDNGGHGLTVTHADRLNADLREFIDR